ncbi:MAG TPA: DUF4236 domain-containing protein [Burkholderiales bacterium]|jgi:hypothetical protein
MGFRFRKTISLIPGVRLNISKSGVSASVGGKGETVNIGQDGHVRGTVGAPGTGISYSDSISGGKRGGGGVRRIAGIVAAAAAYALYRWLH